MSERLTKVDNLCKNPANHEAHICELKTAGKTDDIERLQTNSSYVCNNCGAEANEEGALCAPGPKG